LIATYPNTELESLTFDRDSGTYRAEFDQNRTSAGAAVTALLSAVRDCGPTDSRRSTSLSTRTPSTRSPGFGLARTGDVTVAFSIGEIEVTVYSYGTVAVASADDRPESPNRQPALD